MTFESAFTMDTSSIKYGPGVTREVGYDMTQLGAKRVAVVTDPNLSNSEVVEVVLDSLTAEGIEAVLFDQTRIEPTDASFQEAIDFATAGNFDGYVAVGGGVKYGYRQGRQPLCNLPRRASGLCQPADWTGITGPWAIETVNCHSNDSRNRE